MPGERGGVIVEKVLICSEWTGGGEEGLSGVCVGEDGVSVSEGWLDS